MRDDEIMNAINLAEQRMREYANGIAASSLGADIALGPLGGGLNGQLPNPGLNPAPAGFLGAIAYAESNLATDQTRAANTFADVVNTFQVQFVLPSSRILHYLAIGTISILGTATDDAQVRIQQTGTGGPVSGGGFSGMTTNTHLTCITAVAFFSPLAGTNTFRMQWASAGGNSIGCHAASDGNFENASLIVYGLG